MYKGIRVKFIVLVTIGIISSLVYAVVYREALTKNSFDYVKQQQLLRWQSTPYFKRIVLWTKWFGGEWLVQTGNDVFSACEEKNCFLTPREDEASIGDVYLFHSSDLDQINLPRRHSERQLWALMTMESPAHDHKFKYKTFDGLFNITIDYTNKSDIPRSFGGYEIATGGTFIKGTMIDIGQKKNLALWLVSNCKANSRMRYVEELQKHLSIDVYGKCGVPDTCKADEKCLREMKQKYKFYLAFEDSQCREYITERFWNALRDGIVPIVLGPSLQEYKKVAPPNSYLHVDNFTSPRTLASFVKYLHGNNDAYQYYHDWRRTYRVLGPDGGRQSYYLCKLCKIAHSGIINKTYNISQYWDKDNHCWKN